MNSKFKVGDVLKHKNGTSIIIVRVLLSSETIYDYDTWVYQEDHNIHVGSALYTEQVLLTNAQKIGHIDISIALDQNIKFAAGKPEEEKKEKEKNECDAKESLDKINSALSTLIGYDDLVLRVKVDGDQVKQVKCMKIGEDVIEFETVDKKIRELQKENEGLKEEIDILKSKNNLLREKIERRERDIVNWKKGWYDCLDSFNYYLKA